MYFNGNDDTLDLHEIVGGGSYDDDQANRERFPIEGDERGSQRSRASVVAFTPIPGGLILQEQCDQWHFTVLDRDELADLIGWLQARHREMEIHE